MSVRKTLYGLFLASAMWACGSKPSHPHADKVALADVEATHVTADGDEVETGDYAKQIMLVEQKYPKTHALMHKPGKSPNRYLLQSSAMVPHKNRNGTSVNTCPNVFTLENVVAVANILKQDEAWVRDPDVDIMTLETIAVYEAVRLKAYLDSESKATIGRGVLMPKPGDKNKQDLIGAIRDATADNATYKDIWDSKVGLDAEKEIDLSLDWLTRPGNYKDNFERAVKKAIGKDELGRDLDVDNIPARYQAMITTMLWQTPKLTTRNSEVTNEYLRVLSDSHTDKHEKLQAFDDLNFFYMDQCLLKNFTNEPFADGSARKNLCWRPLVNIMAARAAMHDDGKLEQEAAAAVPERYLLSIAKAMIRDQKNEALMVVIGETEKSVGETAIDIAGLFKPNGGNRVIFSGAGAVFSQKNSTNLEKKIFHEWDAKRGQRIKSDSVLTIPIDDVMGTPNAPSYTAQALRL